MQSGQAWSQRIRQQEGLIVCTRRCLQVFATMRVSYAADSKTLAPRLHGRVKCPPDCSSMLKLFGPPAGGATHVQACIFSGRQGDCYCSQLPWHPEFCEAGGAAGGGTRPQAPCAQLRSQ